MKNSNLSMVLLAMVIAVSSCSSKDTLDADVRKMAQYRCKLQQLSASDPSDEKTLKELADLKVEMEEYRSKMEKKYGDKKKDEKMNKRASEIMDEEMAKCK